jgi:hypothetical protein
VPEPRSISTFSRQESGAAATRRAGSVATVMSAPRGPAAWPPFGRYQARSRQNGHLRTLIRAAAPSCGPKRRPSRVPGGCSLRIRSRRHTGGKPWHSRPQDFRGPGNRGHRPETAVRPPSPAPSRRDKRSLSSRQPARPPGTLGSGDRNHTVSHARNRRHSPLPVMGLADATTVGASGRCRIV